MTRQAKDENDKPYVLSKKDAWLLLAAASDYAHTPDRTINGKDRAEIVAEAALAKGHSDLARVISGIHSSIMDFRKGNVRAMQYLLEGPVLREDVHEYAKGTGFEEAASDLVAHVGGIADVEAKIGDRRIDWEASSKVLLKVKKDRFPQELTMIEKFAVAAPSSSKRSR
jgi:hypothetical protein